MLPEEIPDHLQRRAMHLPHLEEGEAAWPFDAALAVLRSLQGTTIAVLSVVIFEPVPGGHAPAPDGWACRRLANEAATDFASRSRLGAREFIEKNEARAAHALFMLAFPMWKDAA